MLSKINFLALLAYILLISTVYAQTNEPLANPDAIVQSGQARFTVLSPYLIRMEYSAKRKFENRASTVVLNRRRPTPKFTVAEEDGHLTIKTEALTLRYKINSGSFNKNNLSVAVHTHLVKTNWVPGLPNEGNLLGTTRTLDGCDGPNTWDGDPIALEPGVLSRAGWYLLDDSQSFLLDDSPWPWVVPKKKTKERQDWYFFGYGQNYKQALADYTAIAGKIPMPPRYAFGYWWSRYWAYSDPEFKALVDDFRRYDIPMDVLVIDMDWHLTHGGLKDIKNPKKDPFGELLGWTGYTWNKALFPDPQKFMEWTNQQQLKTALNLHPASGIAPMEVQYADFARQYGFKTNKKAWIPYRMAEKKWANTYFDVVLKPYEEWGVDFWWLDWQQFPESKVVPGLSNTWWLNYTFFTSMAERTGTRPLLFHRWGGLGNHRYQIGFSGDYKISWPSLAYQPYFTSTASNVGYGYWSHDIGGHASGDFDKDPELYTRWLQFGIFSPILRTHSAKISTIERRFWMYPGHFKHMRELIHLRYALAPYTYTMAREAYDQGIAICRPMYYDYPGQQAAYDFKGQYMYGGQMIVAPVATPVGTDLVAEQSVWLPEGHWFEWGSGARLTGGQVHQRNYMVEELPVFVKEGAIVPMYPKIDNLQKIPNQVVLRVYPGTQGSFRLYEDHGDSEAYQSGEYATTQITQREEGNQKLIDVFAVQGTYQGAPATRSVTINLPVSFPPTSVMVNGKAYAYSATPKAGSYSYNGQNLATQIVIPEMPVSTPLAIKVVYPEAMQGKASLLYGKPGEFKRLQQVIGLMKIEIARENWWALLSDRVFAAEQTPVNISYNPDQALEQLQLFEENYEAMLQDMRKHKDARKKVTDNLLVPLER